MKHIATLLLGLWSALSMLHAQTVATITTNASKIDDDIIFDVSGNLYGSNYVGSSVYKRTPDGVESVFVTGLSSPNGMAFQNDSTLILADNTGNKLYKVFPDGSKEVLVPSLASPSGLLRQVGSDTILVTSYTTHKIWKLAPDGTLSDYLSHPQFNGPVGMCYDEDENLYIANFNDRKIFKLSPDGQLTFFTQPPLGQYIGFLAYAGGHIYATAMNAHKIYRINLDGSYSVWLGSTLGNTDGDASVAKFNQPNGIRASSTGDTLYVSELGSKKVRMITQLNGSSGAQEQALPVSKFSASPNPASGTLYASFELLESQAVSLELYDNQGEMVQNLLSDTFLPSGRHEYSIERNDLPDGMYFLHLRAGNRLMVCKVLLVS